MFWFEFEGSEGEKEKKKGGERKETFKRSLIEFNTFSSLISDFNPVLIVGSRYK